MYIYRNPTENISMIPLKECFCLFLLTFCQVLITGLREIQPSYSEPINHSLGALRTAQKSFLPKPEVHLTTASQAKAYPTWGFCRAGWTLSPAPLPRAECTSSTAPFIHNPPTRESLSTLHCSTISGSHTTQHHKLFHKAQNVQIPFFQQKPNNRHLYLFRSLFTTHMLLPL